jgi:hypothetical protein
MTHLRKCMDCVRFGLNSGWLQLVVPRFTLWPVSATLVRAAWIACAPDFPALYTNGIGLYKSLYVSALANKESSPKFTNTANGRRSIGSSRQTMC